MIWGFWECLKRERDIRIKPKLRGGKTGVRWTPALSIVSSTAAFWDVTQPSQKKRWEERMINIDLVWFLIQFEGRIPHQFIESPSPLPTPGKGWRINGAIREFHAYLTGCGEFNTSDHFMMRILLLSMKSIQITFCRLQFQMTNTFLHSPPCYDKSPQ